MGATWDEKHESRKEKGPAEKDGVNVVVARDVGPGVKNGMESEKGPVLGLLTTIGTSVMVVTRGNFDGGSSVDRREPGPGVAYGTKSSACTPASEHESCPETIRVVFGLEACMVGDNGQISFDNREPGPGVENGKTFKAEERLDLSSAEYALGSKRHFWENLTDANYRRLGSQLRRPLKDQAERQRLVHLRHW
jgi:hypothetical protein